MVKFSVYLNRHVFVMAAIEVCLYHNGEQFLNTPDKRTWNLEMQEQDYEVLNQEMEETAHYPERVITLWVRIWGKVLFLVCRQLQPKSASASLQATLLFD